MLRLRLPQDSLFSHCFIFVSSIIRSPNASMHIKTVGLLRDGFRHNHGVPLHKSIHQPNNNFFRLINNYSRIPNPKAYITCKTKEQPNSEFRFILEVVSHHRHRSWRRAGSFLPTQWHRSLHLGKFGPGPTLNCTTFDLKLTETFRKPITETEKRTQIFNETVAF